MKISANWIYGELPWLHDVSLEEVQRRMHILGHHLEITPEVWDVQCQGIYGVNAILRELSAAFGKVFHAPQPRVLDEDMGSIYEHLDADVWSDTLCNRFTVKMGVNLKTCMTPDWMKERILSAGLAITDCVQDVATYVALECGQPIHLLDTQGISDSAIALRESYGFETVEDWALPSGVPILESGEEILAIPSYWTSPNCTVSCDTKSVAITAVNYPNEISELCGEVFGMDPKWTYLTDPLLTITAVERMCQLIQELDYGQILEGTIDILNYIPNPLKLDLQALDMGDIPLTQNEINTLLEVIGISADGLIPSWRPDLDSPEAVVKEVVRLHRVNTQTKD